MGSLVFDLSTSDQSLVHSWTFKDITVDLSTDEKNRNVNINLDGDAVIGGITNMFLFAQGERIINPEFGNSIYQYLYEPINDMTAKKIGREIILMFERWEPRVVIQRIRVTPYVDENTYHISVIYTVPSIGDEELTFEASVNARR